MLPASRSEIRRFTVPIFISIVVKAHGYATEIINGIPSFCAVSAKLQDSLVDRSEQLHIIPSTYDIEAALELPGTKVLMKAASKMPACQGDPERKAYDRYHDRKLWYARGAYLS